MGKKQPQAAPVATPTSQGPAPAEALPASLKSLIAPLRSPDCDVTEINLEGRLGLRQGTG